MQLQSLKRWSIEQRLQIQPSKREFSEMYDVREKLEERREAKSGVCAQLPTRAITIIGGAVLVLAAVGILTQWRDIKRYVRIVKM